MDLSRQTKLQSMCSIPKKKSNISSQYLSPGGDSHLFLRAFPFSIPSTSGYLTTAKINGMVNSLITKRVIIMYMYMYSIAVCRRQDPADGSAQTGSAVCWGGGGGGF